MKPLNNNILLKKVSIENTNNMGLILGESSKSNEYEVIEVYSNDLQIVTGDKVIVDESKLIEVDLQQTKYYIVKYVDILLKL